MGDERLDSEFYSAESLAADNDLWITFDGRRNTESLDEWLDCHKPSQISQQDGVGWICVRLPKDEDDDDDGPDVVGLQEAWERLQHSGRPINYHTISELAKAYGVKAGKWFLHVDSGGKVDHLWRLIAYGVMEGRLGDCAKVSPYSLDKNHVICVYNSVFTDNDEVLRLENAIRHSCGIKCPLKYKPDVYTYLGVYRNNKWGLRPSVYESVYDICLGASRVKSTVVIGPEEPMDM